MPTMPKLLLPEIIEGLTKTDAATLRTCCNKRTGLLKATKPYKKIDFADPALPTPLFKANANYVWRMLCFDFCDHAPHNCMPCTADWDVLAWCHRTEAREDCSSKCKTITVRLDELVTLIEGKLPITAQKGGLRWGRALGML